MKKTTNLIVAVLMSAAACFAGVKINGAGIEYSAITTAVNNAVGGDVLIVTTGTYYEAVNISGLNIDIDGGYKFDYSTKYPPGSTIIDAPLFSGSCIDIENSTVKLTDLELTGSSFLISGSGGGLDIRNNSDVMAVNCNIHNNWAPESGGGIYIRQSTLILSNTPVSSCSSDFGGGIYANDSSITLLAASLVQNNEADFSGGGIYLVNNSLCDVANTAADIKNNYAINGGGVAANGSSFVLHRGADIVGNTAIAHGGGIYLNNNATALLYGFDTSIGYYFPAGGLYPNSVTNGSGGGIYAENSTVILSNNARFASNNATENGGGIYLTNSDVYIYHANVGYADNNATNYVGNLGGGIYAIDSSLIITNKCNIMKGYAGEGGGIYADRCIVNISDSTIGNTNINYGNIAFAAGGLELINSTSSFNNVNIVGNMAVVAGGIAFSVTNDAIVVNSVISNNFTYGFGGAGVYNRSIGSFVFDNSEIVNNTAITTAGGIFWDSDATLILRNNSRLCNNVSSNNIGGLLLNKPGMLQFENSEISGNQAVEDVGGIAAIGGKISLVDCVVNNNQGDLLGETNGFCGGIYIENGNLDIVASNSNFLIISNSAAASAGIYAINAKVSIKAFPGKLCKISGNSAIEDGGGLYFSDGTTATISGNVSIDMNTALRGAGLYTTNNCLISAMANSGGSPAFIDNTANYMGGGIFCHGNSSVFLTNVLITGNSANFGCGGMLISENSEVTAISSKFIENFAPMYGAIGCGASKLTIDSDFSLPNSSDLPSSVISGNRATNYAGIYADAGDIYIANTIIASNSATLVGAVTVANSTGQFINLIVADNYGGGLGDGLAFANNQLLEIQNCTIANNYSNGIYQSTNGVPAYLQNCIVWGHLDEQVSSNATAVFCDIQDGFPGAFNITNDPQFVDTAALNYQVIGSSPTINSGMTLLNVTNDCIGNPRPYDGNWDMGAYEFVPEPFCLSFVIYCLLFALRKFNSKS